LIGYICYSAIIWWC